MQNTLSSYLDHEIKNLSLLHTCLDIARVNDARLHLYHQLNNKFDWKPCILECVGSVLFELIGADIMLQTRINVSIQLPNDHSSVLPMHSDCVSGDSPWQLNIWLPLTPSIQHNSMFLYSQADTLDYIKCIKSSNSNHFSDPETSLNSQRFWVEASESDVLIFNPAVLHGNSLNTTPYTRVSLNVRVKSLFAPDALNDNPDRKACTYYQPYKISDNTAFAMNLNELMHSKI